MYLKLFCNDRSVQTAFDLHRILIDEYTQVLRLHRCIALVNDKAAYNRGTQYFSNPRWSYRNHSGFATDFTTDFTADFATDLTGDFTIDLRQLSNGCSDFTIDLEKWFERSLLKLKNNIVFRGYLGRGVTQINLFRGTSGPQRNQVFLSIA